MGITFFLVICAILGIALTAGYFLSAGVIIILEALGLIYLRVLFKGGRKEHDNYHSDGVAAAFGQIALIIIVIIFLVIMGLTAIVVRKDSLFAGWSEITDWLKNTLLR